METGVSVNKAMTYIRPQSGHGTEGTSPIPQVTCCGALGAVGLFKTIVHRSAVSSDGPV